MFLISIKIISIKIKVYSVSLLWRFLHSLPLHFLLQVPYVTMRIVFIISFKNLLLLTSWFHYSLPYVPFFRYWYTQFLAFLFFFHWSIFPFILFICVNVHHLPFLSWIKASSLLQWVKVSRTFCLLNAWRKVPSLISLQTWRFRFSRILRARIKGVFFVNGNWFITNVKRTVLIKL